MQQLKKSMPHRLSSLVGAGLIFLTVVGLFIFPAMKGNGDDTTARNLLEDVLARGVIRVSTDANSPPQSSLKSDGTFEGFDIDVAIEIARRLGVEVEFVVPGGWDTLTAGNWGDQWDMSVGSMTITKQRAEVLHFTSGYYFTSAQFAARRGAGLTTIDDIHGKAVCVGLTTTYHRYLTGKDIGIPTSDIKVEAPIGVRVIPLSDAECLQAIQVGRQEFDILLTSGALIDRAIANGVDLVKVGEPVFVETLAVAFDRSSFRDSSTLREKVSRIIEEMHADGTLSEFSKKWFDGADFTVVSSSKR
ncbi:MAG: transporter substrate-binding domain-containing protein [Anaerolineales bacterium]|nr:transporter substrate-binding domain-containing protein [Anaerolineales bacterium]